MGIRDKVLDMWSFYDYKARFTESDSQVIDYPQWVPRADMRRITAYSLLESYYRNYAREWLNKDADVEAVKARREYGDPNLIVQVTLSSLLGNSQKILTKGSIGGEVPGAVDQQELLEEWSRMEKFPMKIVENERQAVKLGDSVYVLGWDDLLKRPRLNVYDPGFYFPIFDPINQGAEDFPKRVHIAYEYEEEHETSTADNPKYEIMVRRITWHLMPVAEGSAEETCWFQDAIWKREDIDRNLDRFDISKARELISADESDGWMDLGIDFIPVVHMPNTVNLQSHFGDATVATVMQILDDIVATDSDVQAASGTTGSPPLFIKGTSVSGQVSTYGPGTMLSGGEGIEVVDTSNGLKVLLELKDALLERLSVNSRTPESLLGRVKPNEVPSGIALTLSFAPHTSMIQEMRIVRTDKYQLLLKFVAKFYQLAGQLAEVHPVDLILGSFLPADKQEAMVMIVQLLNAKAISLETAVQMAIDAGFNIEDVVVEIERINSRDYEGANQLIAMTGDVNIGMEHLGRPPIADEELPDQGDDAEAP